MALIVAHGAAILAWAQSWVRLDLDGIAVDASGSVAANGVFALSLAGLALVGALAITGRLLRAVLGVLQAVLSFGVLLATIAVFRDPVAAAGSAVTEVTGIAGERSVAALVDSATTTAWPWLAIAAGASGVLLGVAILVTASAWPSSGRRYESAAATASEGAPSAVDDWDALSAGEDPS